MKLSGGNQLKIDKNLMGLFQKLQGLLRTQQRKTFSFFLVHKIKWVYRKSLKDSLLSLKSKTHVSQKKGENEKEARPKIPLNL